MEKVVYIGVDGGASKTAAVVCDATGHVLARLRRGGIVIHAQPTPDSLAVLAATINELLAEAKVPAGANWFGGIGVSGIDFDDEIPSQIQAIEQALGLTKTRLKVVNDGIVALWGASPAERAVILQHGSGLTSAVRNGLGTERIFDCLDAAGLYDLRDEAVHVVCRMIDGREPSSPLRECLLRHWQVEDPARFSELVYRGRIPWQRLRSCVPGIFECWLAGDLAAGRMVRRAVTDYAIMVEAMLAQVGGTSAASASAEVALGGGVIAQAPERFWHLLRVELTRRAPEASPRKPALPPEFGAAVMACHHAGGDAKALFAGLEHYVKNLKEKHAHD